MSINTDMTEGIKPVMIDPVQNDGENALGTTAALLQAKGLTMHSPAGVSLLSDISFHIEPGEFVALTGLSRSRTSLLLQCLAGLIKPASGEILIDGVSLYAHLRDFRVVIGYVPAQFALHENQRVADILQETARLRLPRSTASQDRRQRVQTVLETTGLAHMKDKRAGMLNEVDKRKLSIAVELIAYPKLFLLDASEEPLTPFDEVHIAILMREISRQGITVLHVNPRSRSAGLSDKILFLAPGGRMAWFGPSDEALTYLKNFLPRGVVKDLFGLQEAIEMLVNPQERDGIEWAKRFQDDLAYQKYVDDPLHNRYPDLLLQTRPLLRIRLRNSAKEKLAPPASPRASALQKFFLLLRRSFRLSWRDQTGLLMLAVPPVVALVYLFLSIFVRLETDQPLTSPGLLVFLITLTGGFLARNEIFKETAVYQRENRMTPLLVSYVMSKVFFVGFWAIYQGSIWTIVQSLGELGSILAGGPQVLLPTTITYSLLAFVGGIIGLIVSALSSTAMTTGWVLSLILPLLLFVFDPLGHWSRMAIMSLLLIVLLMAIQQRAANVRI